MQDRGGEEGEGGRGAPNFLSGMTMCGGGGGGGGSVGGVLVGWGVGPVG